MRLMVSFLSLAILLLGCATLPEQEKEEPQPAPAAKEEPKSSMVAPSDDMQLQGGEPEEPTPPEEPPLPEEPAPPEEPEDRQVDEWMGAGERAKKELAGHYYRSGLAHYKAGRLVKAARDLKLAKDLDPMNEDARRLYMTVLWLLGARKGEVHDYARDLITVTKVRIQQLQWEMERAYVKGRRLFDEKKFEEAAKQFEHVLELIKWAPYFIDEKGYEEAAKFWIDLARIEAEAKRTFQVKQRMEMAKESRETEEIKRLRYEKAKIAEGIEEARRLIKRQRFEDAEILLRRLLQKDPSNTEAIRLQQYAISERHRTKQVKNVKDLVEYWARVIQDIHQSAIPYQNILYYPPEEEWEIIAQRAIPVMEEIEKERSPAEKMILSKLDTSKITVNFRETPFGEAIEFLRDVSGLNIFLTRDARDTTEGLTVTLQVRDLPLRNVLALLLEVEASLRWLIKYDVIYITTEEPTEEELLLEFYSVSEIVMVPPDYKAPEIALRTGASDEAGAGGPTPIIPVGDEDEDMGPGVDPDKLIELIEMLLSDEEEAVGEVQYGNGILVVRKPLSAHLKIQKLLESLRRTVGILVTVECRFIEVQDNFLEEVSVDWTGLDRTINDLEGPGGSTVPIGYHYINAQGQNELRGALINEFSLPVGAGFPFALTNDGGLAVQWMYTDVFQVQALLQAVTKRQEALELFAPRLTIFNTQRSYVMAMYQEAYLRDIDINTTGLPTLQPVMGILNHGAIMEVMPIVSYDKKYVLLEVRPSVAQDFTGVMDRPNRRVILQGGLTDVLIELPSLTLTKIRATVICPDGGHIMLAGMKGMLHSEYEMGIPLVNDIPIVKNIFRRKMHLKARRSQVVLLRADITILREEEKRLFGKATW